MNKKLKGVINNLLVAVLSISCWEVGKKQFNYTVSTSTYSRIQEEKNNHNNVQEYLSQNNFDWINISDTVIDYPLAHAVDNDFYLKHDINGKDDISGSIFYDSYDEPYDGNLTIVYGHNMRNGKMFGELKKLKNSKEKFNESVLTIETSETTTKYKPVGYAVVNARNPFYRFIDEMSIEETIKSLKENCSYIK